MASLEGQLVGAAIVGIVAHYRNVGSINNRQILLWSGLFVCALLAVVIYEIPYLQNTH